MRTAAISSVLSNYQVLCDALGEIHEIGCDEYTVKAGGYLASMEKFSTLFGLRLSHLLFSATEQLSLTLQGKDTTIQDAMNAANLTLAFLERQRSPDSFVRYYSKVVAESHQLTSEPALPRYRKRPRRYDDGQSSHRYDSPQSYYRQQYLEAIDLVHSDLRARFNQERGMPVAAVLEKTLLSSANNELSTNDLPSELKLYSKDVDVDRFLLQLKMLPDLVKAYNETHSSTPVRKVTNVRTLCEILNNVSSSKSLFSEVFKMIQLLLTIPVTTATAEQTFSVLRRLKTFLRSTVSQPRLNHALLLHIHKDRTDNINLISIAKEFISFNERRQNYFGTIA